MDSPLASESGEFYFYSPEELDGSRGAFGSRNLYVYRDGAPQHVATLDPSRPATRIQVTPDGRQMAFITSTKLTGYDNAGRAAMYRYGSATRSLTCVSCRPDGDPPAGLVEASQNGLFITNDGRVFFSTEDALVPRDADGIRDVYEYVDGRAQLITSGAGDAAASQNQRVGLVGVSSNGVDVYFATVDKLVPEDENGPFLKFYDARTNGGFPFNKPPAPCEAADECHGTETQDPAPLVVGTGADLGAGGNLPVEQGKKAQRKGKRGTRRCGRAPQREALQAEPTWEGGAMKAGRFVSILVRSTSATGDRRSRLSVRAMRRSPRSTASHRAPPQGDTQTSSPR